MFNHYSALYAYMQKKERLQAEFSFMQLFTELIKLVLGVSCTIYFVRFITYIYQNKLSGKERAVDWCVIQGDI